MEILVLGHVYLIHVSYRSCCFFMNLSFWSSSCFLRSAVCMMAWVWAISSWGLGTRGTTGGLIVAVPVDCKIIEIVSYLLISSFLLVNLIWGIFYLDVYVKAVIFLSGLTDKLVAACTETGEVFPAICEGCIGEGALRCIGGCWLNTETQHHNSQYSLSSFCHHFF